jgi:hypothetical protein
MCKKKYTSPAIVNFNPFESYLIRLKDTDFFLHPDSESPNAVCFRIGINKAFVFDCEHVNNHKTPYIANCEYVLLADLLKQ